MRGRPCCSSPGEAPCGGSSTQSWAPCRALTHAVPVRSFDSSVLEYRRLLPLLAQAGLEPWAVDVVGWGFTDAGFATDRDTVLGPAQKRDHLYAFWKAQVGLNPVALQGPAGKQHHPGALCSPQPSAQPARSCCTLGGPLAMASLSLHREAPSRGPRRCRRSGGQ